MSNLPGAVESRVSYFMIQDDKQKSLNKKSLLHRLFSVCEINPDLADKKQIDKFFQNVFEQLHRKSLAETSTGLLIVYPDFAIHFLESSSDVITEVITKIDEKPTCKQNTEDGKVEDVPLFLETKIITIMHDINRILKNWRCHHVTAARGLGKPDMTVPIESYVSDIVTPLLKLAFNISKSPMINQPNNFGRMAAAYMPSTDHLLVVMKTPSIQNTTAYLQQYHAPVDVVLDSERLWPIDQDVIHTICT